MGAYVFVIGSKNEKKLKNWEIEQIKQRLTSGVQKARAVWMSLGEKALKEGIPLLQ